MKRLIINADDFGLNELINSAIIKGYRNGFITSTTIMPSGIAFESAAESAKENPNLGVGVHLTLVAEKPVSAPSKIPTLVNNDGYFPPQYPQFLLRYMLGKITIDDIRRELTAQVKKVTSAGINITHIDSHQHLHIIPEILTVVIDIAKEHKIRALRIPDESYFFFGSYPFSLVRFVARCGLTYLARIARHKVRKNNLVVPNHFFGMLAGGNMQEKYLSEIIRQIPDGVSEIMVHPGSNNKLLSTQHNWEYHWEEELLALTSKNIGRLITDKDISLVSFRELSHG